MAANRRSMRCLAKAALPEPHAAELIIGGYPSYPQRGKAWDLIPLFDRFIPLFDGKIPLFDRLAEFAPIFISDQVLRSIDLAPQEPKIRCFLVFSPRTGEMIGSVNGGEDQRVEGGHTGAARADQERVDLDAG